MCIGEFFLYLKPLLHHLMDRSQPHPSTPQLEWEQDGNFPKFGDCLVLKLFY